MQAIPRNREQRVLIGLHRVAAGARFELGVLRYGRRFVVPIEVPDQEPPTS